MEIELPFPSFRSAKGIWQHHLRQSDANDFRMCPESFRQTRHELVPKFDNDTAVIGTASHLGFSSLLDGQVDTLADAVEVAHNDLSERWPTCRKLDVPDEQTAFAQVAGIVETFWNEVYESLLEAEVVAVERRFDVLANRTPSRELYLSGTSDVWLKDRNADFKTSTKDWQRDAWKVNRYNLQSTFYAWARDQVELGDKHDQARRFTLDYAYADELYPMEFSVINRETFAVQRLTVERTVADAKMLHDELQRMCDAIEYLPKSGWPMRPDDWFCSDKWCPAWSNCRGKYLGDDPWGLMERSKANQSVSVRPSEMKANKVIEGLQGMVKENPS